MKYCYVPKRFEEATLRIVVVANDIIEDYKQQGLSLTLRQLYYRFIAADAFSNTEKSYKRLGSIVNNARLAGLIDWESIEDRGREVHQPAHWDSPADIIESAAASFRIDKWSGQPRRAEVWVEKQALESIVGRAAKALDTSYFSCKGYTSQSAMWRASQRIKGYHDDGQEVTIIHLGDHDPSGIDMTRDIVSRLNTTFGSDVTVERIALNMDQVRKYAPPPNPAKLSDSRAQGYIERFGSSSWELDALEPAALHALIQKSIRGCIEDPALFDDLVDQEDVHRDLMGRISSEWDRVQSIFEDGVQE